MTNILKNNIIGTGMIAYEVNSSWHDTSKFLIFASGVSDSLCISEEEFNREKTLLLSEIKKMNENHTIIYFSSCSIYDNTIKNHSPYVSHKLEMESIVKKCKKYQIFRLPQVVGGNRTGKTLVSHFYQCLINGKEIVIQSNARRNLIDVSDVVKMASYIATNKTATNSVVNIASTRYDLASDIVKTIGEVCKIKPITRYINGGSSYKIDTMLIERLPKTSRVLFDDNYLFRLIKNYYG